MKLTALLAVALAACVQASCPRYQFTVFTATSSNAAGLAATVKDYQNALGGINNVNELGPIATGFRQVSLHTFPRFTTGAWNENLLSY